MDTFSILRRRFPEREYALLEEVRDKAGFSASRSADYIAIGLWPSRGLTVSGIEKKAHRSDWLGELKNPKKAESIFQYCDYFWLLTTDESVAKIEEIPETWGWLCIKGGRVITKKDAPNLSPVAISRHFFCAAIKRASDKTQWVRYNEIAQKVEAAEERGKNGTGYEIQRLRNELKELHDNIDEFQKASGINLKRFPSWETSPSKMGEAVAFINKGGAEPIKKQLLGLKETATIVLQRIADGLKSLE